MTAELERYAPTQPPAPHPDVDSWIAVIGDVAKLASHISDTQFVPESLRGNAAAVAAAILSGREAGVGPMASLQNIAVIRGRPAQSALLMRQLALAAGHDIRYVETTDSRCVVEGRRRGTERWERVTFTADQARKARIDLGGYPEDKLVARATARLCRRVFSDAIGGTPYSVEELEDGVEADGLTATTGAVGDAAEHAPPAATAAPRTAQRKTRAKPPTARTAPPEVPPAEPEDLPPLPGEDGYDQPDTEPEPEPDKHIDPPRPITDPQMRKLQTLFTKHQIKDRGDRLLLASQLAGRDLETAKDLTVGEASTVIDTLERAEAIAGEQFGDFLQRLTVATQSDPALDIDPDTGEVIPELSEGNQ